MSVCYLFQGQYPWDIRVEKIVSALNEEDIETHIISRNMNGLPIKEKLMPHVYVHRINVTNINKINGLMNFPAFFSPFWIKKIFQVIKEYKLKIIIVRDLPLAPAAILAGKIFGIPVIMDMAENYPAMIQDTWRFRGPHIHDYLLRNPNVLRVMEKWVINRLDGILVVSEESKERISQFLCKNSVAWIIGNTPRLDQTESFYHHPLIDRISEHCGLKLIYVGGLESSRGLETVIRSLPLILSDGIEILLVVVGDGESRERLKKLACDYGLEKNIIFTGFIEQKFIPSIIKSSDICIIPHYVTEHTDTTIPNKIYDYMAQKKPIIATNSRTLSRIIKQGKCGYIYEDFNNKELAQIIKKLVNADLRKQLGESGYGLVRSVFNWSEDKAVLMDAIRYYYSYAR
jgi:glycosyltransferase involved in cell wall biosynthesis